jgi:hypothetical protein
MISDPENAHGKRCTTTTTTWLRMEFPTHLELSTHAHSLE